MKAKGNKVTLSTIYGWIKENFLYYRYADPSWKVIYNILLKIKLLLLLNFFSEFYKTQFVIEQIFCKSSAIQRRTR